jgi:hypothetical protein
MRLKILMTSVRGSTLLCCGDERVGGWSEEKPGLN